MRSSGGFAKCAVPFAPLRLQRQHRPPGGLALHRSAIGPKGGPRRAPRALRHAPCAGYRKTGNETTLATEGDKLVVTTATTGQPQEAVRHDAALGAPGHRLTAAQLARPSPPVGCRDRVLCREDATCPVTLHDSARADEGQTFTTTRETSPCTSQPPHLGPWHLRSNPPPARTNQWSALCHCVPPSCAPARCSPSRPPSARHRALLAPRCSRATRC